MHWVFYHGVFGCWGWEKFGDGGEFVSESRDCFESREEAEIDAAAHGYRAPRSAPQTLAGELARRSGTIARIARASRRARSTSLAHPVTHAETPDAAGAPTGS